MTKSWRPEGWEDITVDSLQWDMVKRRIYEAGADAILEELAKLKAVEIYRIIDTIRVRNYDR